MVRIKREKAKKEISDWSRHKTVQKSASGTKNYKKITQIIQKAEKTPLSTRDIYSCLLGTKNFLGIFSCDELKTCSVTTFPVLLIVNLDQSSEPGSHWISIRIGRRYIEIFDSLGFNPKLWGKFPSDLFQFLFPFRYTHVFKISPVLQPPNTVYCGAFCIYFILKRQHLTFNDCLKIFSAKLYNNYYILKKYIF